MTTWFGRPILSYVAKRTNIEEQLRQAIIGAPINPCQLSKRSGVARAVISRFLGGSRSITMETAAKLADALELELTARKRKGR